MRYPADLRAALDGARYGGLMKRVLVVMELQARFDEENNIYWANKLQEEGQSKLEAVKNAAMTRLRPVLMTSVATVCGHFPLTS